MAKKPAHHAPRDRQEQMRKHREIVERRLEDVPTSGRRIYLNVMNGCASIQSAVKVMCMECIGWTRPEVEHCTSVACPLYRFRPFVAPDTVLDVVGKRVKGKARNKTTPAKV